MSLIQSGEYDDELDISDELRLAMQPYLDWENLDRNHFIRHVEEGRKGRNVGWDVGSKKLASYTYGKHRGRYYLIGADSGVGKTTIADFMHLHKTYEYATAHGHPWFCYYYSLELSKTEKIARWVSYAIWMMFGKALPSDYIMGRIDGVMVTDSDLQLIRAGYAYIERMLKHMVIVEDAVHPTKIFTDLVNHHYDEIHGKVLRAPSRDPKKPGTITGFVPKEGLENAMVDVVIDHLALLHSEQKLDTKGTMDLMSKYAVAMRNLFGTTFTFIQQFSTDMQTWHRSAKKISDKFIAPQRLDFGDSKYTYRDADLVLGLVNPYQFELETYFGYEVDLYQGYLLGLHVMKNRYGLSNRLVPLFLNPLVGVFEDMPKPVNMPALENFQDKATQITDTCQRFSQTT